MRSYTPCINDRLIKFKFDKGHIEPECANGWNAFLKYVINNATLNTSADGRFVTQNNAYTHTHTQ